MPDTNVGRICTNFELLLARARSGDPEARGRVLQQFWLALLHDARRDLPYDLRSKGGGSDLVQETMLDAHKDFAHFTGRSEWEFLAWLQCLLQQNFSNFIRAYRNKAKRQVSREVPLPTECGRPHDDGRGDATDSPTGTAIRREWSERFRRALERLPGEIGELIRMRFDDHQTYAEIGVRLDMSAEAARKLLTRTLRLLAEELRE
jgi:RNA polymerase sigma-70 factor (subfamily 1)